MKELAPRARPMPTHLGSTADQVGNSLLALRRCTRRKQLQAAVLLKEISGPDFTAAAYAEKHNASMKNSHRTLQIRPGGSETLPLFAI